MNFRRFRILLLLGVLAGVIGFTWLEQFMVRGWRGPLDIAVIPINGDGSAEATEAIRAMQEQDFLDIGVFLEREVARYGVKHAPAMQVTVLPELKQKPPAPPRDGSVLKTMLWSLKLRGWVYRQSDGWLPQPGRIKLFLLYHAPEDGVALEHSLGLQKGLIGVVHVFADRAQAAQNNIVIAHELLHTLGATDKYEAGGMPRYPQGYAEPELPQSAQRREAEIMAGRLVGANGEPVMPPGLERCVVGPLTAYEIGLDDAFKRRYAAR
ncbi:MAG: hypothetical protein ROZ09_01125 [Thiobacillus sp.]|jgi:hypothetical protein|uniref:hypothetical protein n=1 Tax=Thiobacillus sp. TaxID=924 RepID=UPI002893C832|nr:hypothetical protein [Thiobacillus sp.]MDT3705396.1 hypothetical protein [Thiobacillus sp.]